MHPFSFWPRGILFWDKMCNSNSTSNLMRGSRTIFASSLTRLCAMPFLYREFLRQLRDKSGPFVLKLDAVSRDKVQMLDVDLFKGSRFSSRGVLDYRLFVKASSIWKPLSIESQHALSVHATWPLSEIGRINKLFWSKADAGQAVSVFRAR